MESFVLPSCHSIALLRALATYKRSDVEAGREPQQSKKVNGWLLKSSQVWPKDCRCFKSVIGLH